MYRHRQSCLDNLINLFCPFSQMHYFLQRFKTYARQLLETYAAHRSNLIPYVVKSSKWDVLFCHCYFYISHYHRTAFFLSVITGVLGSFICNCVRMLVNAYLMVSISIICYHLPDKVSNHSLCIYLVFSLSKICSIIVGSSYLWFSKQMCEDSLPNHQWNCYWLTLI